MLLLEENSMHPLLIVLLVIGYAALIAWAIKKALED